MRLTLTSFPGARGVGVAGLEVLLIERFRWKLHTVNGDVSIHGVLELAHVDVVFHVLECITFSEDWKPY